MILTKNALYCTKRLRTTNRKTTMNNLPTPEMIDWFQKNTQWCFDWDELYSNVGKGSIRQDFFDTFEDELKGIDMSDVWSKLF